MLFRSNCTLLLFAGGMIAATGIANLNEAGARFFRNQQPAEAVKCFQHSLELDPKQPRVAKLLGLSEQLIGDYERAKQAFTLASELDRNDPEPWYYLGRVYYLENFFGKAIEELRKAIQIDSRDYRPHYYLALTFEAEGRIDAAEDGYRKAIQLNLKRAAPDFSPDYNYGVLLARIGRLEESEKHLKRSSELDPAAWAPPFELGKLYLRKDNLIAAERELISAAKNSTAGQEERSRIYYLLARVYFALGRDADAQKALAAREEAPK